MSFEIRLYENLSEDNRVTKSIQARLTLEGTLKQNTSIVNPSVLIQIPMASLNQCNYAYIPAFGRYYYIVDAITRTTNLVEISLRCDVLMSFATQIKSNTAVIASQEKTWNLYLNDGTIKAYQKSLIGTLSFPNALDASFSYVLLLAGSGASS